MCSHQLVDSSRHNKPLQRTGIDKVLGRGRGVAVLKQVPRARVLMHWRPAAERSRYAPGSLNSPFLVPIGRGTAQ